ncbi:MAG: hypothetical protein A2561_03925 [Candidatus Staskawiczbacteria bacterium RIFOXYD1_FULL_32_13]|uniref:Uncharacterized protein n=2 Tax=Parcubacteria group TaxID=1794811 RepID=A0A1F8DX45_9BACT|nr:MAG: hypothetical protein A2372_01780 [Candidatus Wolfebacteria bacterium RIFOXYB1_FULL_54_12]OGZ89814.1 MAG: hypothetical protein A2561_03925 [Candidatus Staskawiczbacteria bacterium RIFOXYD1_FULL_32_13]
MDIHNNFLKAIAELKFVKLRFNSQEKGIIERECIPFDFGPSRRNLSINPDRYHFYDLDSPEGTHNLSILPDQIISLEVLEQKFEPADYITWDPPYDWFIPRDWGKFS